MRQLAQKIAAKALNNPNTLIDIIESELNLLENENKFKRSELKEVLMLKLNGSLVQVENLKQTIRKLSTLMASVYVRCQDRENMIPMIKEFSQEVEKAL
jgi:hypothetical protein